MQPTIDQLFAAFCLTLAAGLSTGVGSLLALLARRANRAFLSASLGFSAGVMVYVSMVELLSTARASLEAQLGARGGAWAAVGAFFGGILLIAVIDRLIPSEENPHEARAAEEGEAEPRALMRTGVLTALALAVHNFPEGLATFVSALQAPNVALPVVAAIALHNIPEGIAVSVPIYHATGSRRRAFWYSFVSGLAEPLGAVVGYLLLAPVMSQAMLGATLALVAGVMVFISIDELLPAARAYGNAHLSVYGMIAGMAVMAVSLLLFG